MARVATVNTAQLPMGLLLRGKAITDDWQLHIEGCADLKAIQKVLRGRHAIDFHDSIDAARDDFNADMGPGGTAGFTDEEGGWDFDAHVSVKPCTSRKKVAS